MKCHLLVVWEKMIKMIKTAFVMAQREVLSMGQKVKYYRWRHNIFCAQPTYITYIYVYNKGLLPSILWELCSVQPTSDAGRRTMDTRP